MPKKKEKKETDVKRLGSLLAKNLLFELQLKDESPNNLLVSMKSSTDTCEQLSSSEGSNEEDSIRLSNSPATLEESFTTELSENQNDNDSDYNQNELLSEVPTRNKLSLQTVKGERKPLVALREKVAANSEYKSLFCFSHRDFALSSGTDIEHLIPIKQIINRQKALLNYLNDNPQLAKEFMKVKGIEQYFGKNEESKILGTKNFFNESYRQLSNLWLICHACNLGKSSNTKNYNKKGDEALREWLEKQDYLGKDFINFLNSLGKIHNGILFNIVYEKQKTEIIELKMNRSSTRKVELLSEDQLKNIEAYGVATIMRNWLENYYEKALDLEKSFNQELRSYFKEKLWTIIGINNAIYAKEHYINMKKRINHGATALQVTLEETSEEDETEEEEWRNLLTSQAVKILSLPYIG